MKNEGEGYGVVDPLANYWGLSLFPQTSGVLPHPSNLYSPDQDLLATHNHFKSMALRSPSKLLEQTKAIIDVNPALFNPENSSDPTSDERNDVVAEGAKECPRERRPALGLKRARFSLKPDRNQPAENLIPSLDFDKLKDPVEFFLAHERLENAKREIQKQMGVVSFGQNQDNTSTKPRQRRPGLLGNNQQRSVRYKHRYPIETFDNHDYVPSSQEAFESGSFDPVVESTDKAGGCLASLESGQTDSSAMEENKLNDILDRLLHCNGEDLEEDGAINLLQERLQIKPIVLEKLSIPDFPDNQMTDLKSFRGNLLKPRKALSNIDNLLRDTSNKTPLRQDVGSPVLQLASPTPPKSPFASLSSLQKRISQSKPSVDPFSAHYSYQLFMRNSSEIDMIDEEINLVGSGKPSNELNAHLIEDVIAVSKTGSVVDTVGNCAATSGKSKEDNSGKSSNKPNAPVIEDMIAVCKMNSVEDTVRNRASTFGKSKEDNSREPGLDTKMDSNEPHVNMDVDIGGNDMGKRVMDDRVGGPNSEAHGQRKRKVKLHSQREPKDKTLSRRQSLAAAGTSWNFGVRRSTRIRTRPLEYWKGERPVYGRIHESLATVIGVKCMSPGSDGKPTMKVKSYVSNKYKELVELASLY